MDILRGGTLGLWIWFSEHLKKTALSRNFRMVDAADFLNVRSAEILFTFIPIFSVTSKMILELICFLL